MSKIKKRSIIFAKKHITLKDRQQLFRLMLPGLISGASDMKGGVFVSDDSVNTIHYIHLGNHVIQFCFLLILNLMWNNNYRNIIQD